MINTIIYNKENVKVSKVVCVARNYVAHIKELGNEIPSSMVIFNKPNSSITKTLYYFSEHCRFEGEICFLMREGKIDAVGFGLDLTHLDIQNELKAKGLPWERAKAFDNAAVLSEFVSFSGDIRSLNMKLYINDTLTQFADYDLMIYKPHTLIEEIESFMTLVDDDIIMSGTPKGVSNYKVGDKFLGQVFSGDKFLVEKEWIVEKL